MSLNPGPLSLNLLYIVIFFSQQTTKLHHNNCWLLTPLRPLLLSVIVYNVFYCSQTHDLVVLIYIFFCSCCQPNWMSRKQHLTGCYKSQLNRNSHVASVRGQSIWYYMIAKSSIKITVVKEVLYFGKSIIIKMYLTQKKCLLWLLLEYWWCISVELARPCYI